MVNRLLILTTLIAGDLAAAGQNSTASRYLRFTRKDVEEENSIETLRRLVVDEPVLTRYKSVPEGFRQQPSYYSETYLPRARAYTESQKEQLAAEWGSWTFEDPKAATRPNDDFYNQYPNRDVPFADFPASTAWQKDKDFLAKFIPEAIALSERAMEAILAEYGRGKKDMPDSSFEERSTIFGLTVDDTGKRGGGGWMPPSSYEGLKRRILHALMTEDRFTVAMGGHSAAAGHGNHFQQSYTLQIARILEPVFARLGVKATARNFAQGGLGTLQNSVGSGDIYGRDVDVLMWDSSMTENSVEHRGIFAIQGLLSMDRAPLQWHALGGDPLNTIYKLTGADIAVYGDRAAADFKPAATTDELMKIPYASRYFSCTNEMKSIPECARWEGLCWINRTEFVWEGIHLSYTPVSNQQGAPPGRAGWHPGNREHQFQGRSFTFPILKALHDVLMTWNSAPDYVLEDSAWHVTEYYEGIKTKIAENKDSWTRWCTTRLVPTQFCMYSAKARTENTPRALPWHTNLRSIMAGSEHPGDLGLKNEYDPPEVYNPSLDPPEGEIDVLGIIENGIKFQKNLARIHDSAGNMQAPVFTEYGNGSKHNSDIKGGKGWAVDGGTGGGDHCDGEYDSWCARRGNCLMYAHNDGRRGILIDGFSGWLVFNLPKVEHGMIMVKFHTWSFFPPEFTEGWCSENNAEPCAQRALMSTVSEDSSKQVSRVLKGSAPQYCDDFKFHFAIDGKITTWDKEVFQEHRVQADRVVEFVTLLDDDSWEGTKDVEVAIRLTGCGRQKPFSLTHIYWV